MYVSEGKVRGKSELTYVRLSMALLAQIGAEHLQSEQLLCVQCIVVIYRVVPGSLSAQRCGKLYLHPPQIPELTRTWH